jgi:hypothetical protein
VARWYCPTERRSFSLLSDCLAAKLTGTLAEVEAVLRVAAQAPSLEAACGTWRSDIELPGALGWMRRRVQAVGLLVCQGKGMPPQPDRAGRAGACGPALARWHCASAWGALAPCRPDCLAGQAELGLCDPRQAEQPHDVRRHQ